MAFKSITYRVMIASPSDMPEEREAATAAIQDWNAQHAAAEGVVLLPVKWETHATPTSNVRPQQAISDQLVKEADILLGMFWTKVGTKTGVAESGTIEEINLFVSADKPALLYFSSRPIDPDQIDQKQHRKLKAFKKETYNKALVGNFKTLDELRAKILRDLTSQLRKMKAGYRSGRNGILNKLEIERTMTEVIILRKKNKILPADIQRMRDEVGIGAKRRTLAMQRTYPIEPEQTGPNGFPIGYNKNGDKVEFLRDTDDDDEELFWEMIIRRSDRDILKTHNEFWHKVWWNRHQIWKERIKSGEEMLTEGGKTLFKMAEEKAAKIEKKYGKKNLGWDDFEWGLLSGRMSALGWVMGDDWDVSLDT